MGYSNVELANQALDHLGKDRIASLAEASTAARKINEVFERTIHSALARSHWTFSRTQVALAGLTNDYAQRWAYKYDLPNDCATAVRLILSSDPLSNGEQAPYQLRGGYLYTDVADAELEYVKKSTSTSTMPNPFLDAVSFLLARNVSMPLTRKRAFWKDLNQDYEYHLALAIMQDAGQEPSSYVDQTGGEYNTTRGGGDDAYVAGAVDGSIYWR